MKSFYSNFISKGDLCFDIGAHIGNYTQLFVNLGATVVAVEPLQGNLAQLNNKFKNNSNIVILPVAIADQAGESEIHEGNLPELSTLRSDFVQFNENQFQQKWTNRQKVNTITFKQLLDKYGTPAFCKIDVEGFESQVLETLDQPIPCISYEFLIDFKKDAIQCARQLGKVGKAKFNYSLFEFFELELTEWLSLETFITHLQNLPLSHKTGDIFVKFEIN